MKNDDPVIQELSEKAAAGDPHAQFTLGIRYYRSEGVRLDLREAIRLLKAAASQGLPEAQEELGIIYLMEGNPASGESWLRKAAKSGRGFAATLLGNRFMGVRGRIRSPWRARVWYERALSLGDVGAHGSMAALILKGEKTPEKIALAMDHLRKGAQAGNLTAAQDFAVYSYSGWGSPAEADRLLLEVHAWAKRNKTERGGRERSLVLKALFEHRRARAFAPPAPPQVAEAQAELARRQGLGLEPGLEPGDYDLVPIRAHQISKRNLKRLEVAAARGSAYACGRLGCYLGQVWKEGPGGDLDKAIPLVRLAATEGSITWRFAVGTLLIRRNGPGDAAEAAYWLRYGAEQYPEAANVLGLLFSQGRGVPPDDVSAIAFWHIAAGMLPEAAARVGESLVRGHHAPVDEEIGIEMLQRAFEAGNPDAANILGTCHDEGVGVPQDGGTAERFFRAAAVKGVLTAALKLGFLYFDGRRIDPNPAAAVKWLEKAGAVDSGQALHLLSVMVYRGEGTPTNMKRAQVLFRRAQEEGHLPSLFTTLEDEVIRVRPAAVRQRDFAGMIRCAEEAASEGDADAAFLAALAHWNGEADIPRDEEKARRFFRIAAEAGNVLAKACLSEALQNNGATEKADE